MKAVILNQAYILERIKQDPVTNCWNWTRALSRGYGKLGIKGKNMYAHVVAYTVFKKAPELCVLHTCDNPGCCNPEHLFEGTQADNMRDKQLKGRAIGGRPVGSKQLYSGKLWKE